MKTNIMNYIDAALHQDIRKRIYFDATLYHEGKKYKPTKEGPVIGKPYCMWSPDGYWMTFSEYDWSGIWPTYLMEEITIATGEP